MNTTMDSARPQFQPPPDWGRIRLDMAGKLYLIMFGVTTAIFGVGLTLLLMNRHVSYIKLRHLPLVCAAAAALHIQLSFDLLVYPLNGFLPCGLEYWIMMVALPAGIALFQVQNMQLLSLSYKQKHLVSRSKTALDTPKTADFKIGQANPGPLSRAWAWWKDSSYLKRMYVFVAIFLGVEVLIGLVLFMISRRFHASFGLVGTPSPNGYECRMGWEWFPSGIGQAFWTFIFGPYILFRIRNISDTHLWRLQTTLAILFSMPGLPLWLSTWFMPTFYIVNWYWPPSLWFVPGIAAMEFIILFFPLIEIIRVKRLQRRALRSAGDSALQPAEFYSKYSMKALQHGLDEELEELEEFAATKDFTGENIVFLKHVATWQARWRHEAARATRGGPISPSIVKMLYHQAERIFLASVCRETAEFPLNIDEDIYRELDVMFARPRSRAATPINHPTITDESGRSTPERALIAPFVMDSKEAEYIRKTSASPLTGPGRERSPAGRSPWAVPEGFGYHTFEKADAAVKMLVLENTWIRYINSLPPAVAQAKYTGRNLTKKNSVASNSSKSSYGSVLDKSVFEDDRGRPSRFKAMFAGGKRREERDVEKGRG